jgi:hypothetical protein
VAASTVLNFNIVCNLHGRMKAWKFGGQGMTIQWKSFTSISFKVCYWFVLLHVCCKYSLIFWICNIDAGTWKTLGVPVVIGEDNLPSPVGIGLTDLPNIGWGGSCPPGPPVPAALLQGMRLHGCSGCKNSQIFGSSPFAPADFEASSTMCTRCFERALQGEHLQLQI